MIVLSVLLFISLIIMVWIWHNWQKNYIDSFIDCLTDLYNHMADLACLILNLKDHLKQLEKENVMEKSKMDENLYKSLEKFYNIYEVDCDDGTVGDKFYVVKNDNFKNRNLCDTDEKEN